LLTKTLVISGEPGVFTTPNGQRGAMLRAYDKATGKEVGAVYMPAGQTGTPMTYMLNGKQYIVVAIGGSGYSAELRAFRVPGEAHCSGGPRNASAKARRPEIGPARTQHFERSPAGKHR